MLAVKPKRKNAEHCSLTRGLYEATIKGAYLFCEGNLRNIM
jgi:hypothetical protein